MIKKYKEFINEGIFDLLSGYSMEEVKEKLNRLTPLDRYVQLKKLKLTYDEVYTKEELSNFTGLDKVIYKNNYDNMFDFEDIIIVKKNNMLGYIDYDGNEITQIKYDNCWEFFGNRALVVLNKKFGFIDKNGEEIIPLKYDFAHEFKNGKAQVLLKTKWSYIDENGITIK